MICNIFTLRAIGDADEIACGQLVLNMKREATNFFKYRLCWQVNFFIGAFYDGVYLLGMALNETLTEGGDIRDGRNITRRMWGRDFHGKFTNTSTI